MCQSTPLCDAQLISVYAWKCGSQSQPHLLSSPGTATIRGCTMTNNHTAVDVLRGANVDVLNCDISFNVNALEFEGSGTIQ